MDAQDRPPHMPDRPRVLKLSNDLPTAARVTMAILYSVLFALVLAIVALVFGLMAAVSYDSDVTDGSNAASLVLCGVIMAAPLLLGFLYLQLKLLRTQLYLEGTVVVSRAALTSRRVDLATAEVKGDAVPTFQPGRGVQRVVTVPAVSARDPRSGVQIKIPMQGPNSVRLPAHELVAIADAIMAVRRPDDPSYPSAEALVQAIREMAAKPFPV